MSGGGQDLPKFSYSTYTAGTLDKKKSPLDLAPLKPNNPPGNGPKPPAAEPYSTTYKTILRR